MSSNRYLFGPWSYYVTYANLKAVPFHFGLPFELSKLEQVNTYIQGTLLLVGT
jgi:hypothetical protein